jgi:hypothetical protein
MTNLSVVLWEHVSLLSKVQFPWRLGIVVDLCAAILFAVWLEAALKHKWALKPILAFATTIFVLYYATETLKMHPAFWGDLSTERQVTARNYIDKGLDAEEYRPKWSLPAAENIRFNVLLEKLEKVPEVEVIDGKGTVTVLSHNIEQLPIKVESSTPVSIRFRRFYYPGWHLSATPDGPAFDLKPSGPLGLLEAEIPSGTHQLILERRPIKEERIGAAVTFATALVCLGLMLPVWTRKRSVAEPTSS